MQIDELLQVAERAASDVDLYIEQPHGFVIPGKVCKLNMALEGTKQAAHLWQKGLSEFLVEECGMTRSTIDPCLYTMEKGEKKMMIIVWVDDLCVATSDQEMFDSFFTKFSQKYKSTHDAKCDRFVGLEIERDLEKGILHLRQTKYIEKLFNKHLTDRNTKEWKTPSGTSREEACRFDAIGCAETDDERAQQSGTKFLEVIGGLLFASCMTRPDIAYHVGHLCQFMKDPSPAAYEAALGIVAYLYQTKLLGLTYGLKKEHPNAEVPSNSMIPYTDASFGKTPKGTIGAVVTINDGDTVVWYSRKGKLVADSTCKTELEGVVEGLKETMFVKQLVEDMGGQINGKPIIVCDNKAAIDVIRNPGVTKRTAHYERRLYYAREEYMNGGAGFLLVPTHDMMADGMTKVVDRKTFFRCRDFTMGTDMC